METAFVTFRKFTDPDLAEALIQQLEAAGIPCEVEDNQNYFNPTFVKNPLSRDIAIRLRQKDFAAAQQLLMTRAQQQFAEVPAGHFLHEFTDAELKDILQKPDEWNEEIQWMAQTLLKQRGIAIDETLLQQYRTARTRTLARPESDGSLWIVAGYASAILGGVVGLFVGGALAFGKKTLPDGSRIFRYTEGERTHGKIISGISAVLFPVWIWYRLNLHQ
jgi:hypothetical protein